MAKKTDAELAMEAKEAEEKRIEAERLEREELARVAAANAAAANDPAATIPYAKASTKLKSGTVTVKYFDRTRREKDPAAGAYQNPETGHGPFVALVTQDLGDNKLNLYVIPPFVAGFHEADVPHKADAGDAPFRWWE